MDKLPLIREIFQNIAIYPVVPPKKGSQSRLLKLCTNKIILRNKHLDRLAKTCVINREMDREMIPAHKIDRKVNLKHTLYPISWVFILEELHCTMH